jgi:thymidylate synthase
MSGDHYVEERNLSVAWARALQLASLRGRAEVAPLVVAVTGFDDAGNFEEEPRIRSALESLLASEGEQSVDTVANTIFPASMWNSARDRQLLFHRYRKVVPRLRKASRKNSRGIYFERMITGGPQGQENQLDFAISTYLARKGVRRSVLQLGVFDPSRDHSAAAQLGFPCLQHVTFAPSDGGLAVNALYATQYIVERAYGNYVGLCRLGQFVAHEMRLRLLRMTCFTGIAECEVAKNKLAKLLDTIEEVIRSRDQTGA